MQKVRFGYDITTLQQLFVEKGLELLYKDTIDSYRLRLHNPKTIIEELISVCQLAKLGALTNNDYAHATSKEAINLLQNRNDGLQFNSVNREYYLKLIQDTKQNNYNRIIQASKLILRENVDYQGKLWGEIKNILNPINPEEENSKKYLILLIEYLCGELVNLGYTKQYLFIFFRTIFVHISDTHMTFDHRFSIWEGLGSKEKEKYKVIYEINSNTFQFRELSKIDTNYQHVNKRFRSDLPSTVSDKVSRFLEERKKAKLVAIEVQTLDHFKAVEVSRAKLARDLDLYHLGFNDAIFKINLQAAVIGEHEPQKASTLPSNYQIDGFVRSNPQVLDELLLKVGKLKENNVDEESLDKILCAIRYLRTGSESPELETKLLNYWIGLEYIFTSFIEPDKTIDRIKKYYPICHQLIYIKRNLQDFHRAIERIELSAEITGYNDNLEYLTAYSTYDEIKAKSLNELMKFRADYYQTLVSNPDNITKALFKHGNNLEWNFTRLYRIRNEIVHNAAIKNTIYGNVAHLKYYLTFILNSILDFMSNLPGDFNNDGRITIEDYFVAQDIMLGALKGKTLRNYLNVRNPLDILFS